MNTNNTLLELLKDFYNLTQIKVCIYNEDGIELCYYPNKFTPFCAYLRSNQEINDKCINCDKNALELCKNTKKTQIYTCHAGLTECFSPILINGNICGYIAIGQIREKEQLNLSNINSLFKKDELLSLYNKLPIRNKEIIISAIHVLEACAGYKELQKYILERQNSFKLKLEEYISSNVKNNLNVEILCKIMKVSRTELYKQIFDIYKITPAELVKNFRLEYAKKLLLTTKKQISVIAEECGIGDYNYFSKTFKKHFKKSPREIRKLEKNIFYNK